MSGAAKFWSDFVAQPQALSQSSGFSRMLWQGVQPPDQRGKVWAFVADRKGAMAQAALAGASQGDDDDSGGGAHATASTEEVLVAVDVELTKCAAHGTLPLLPPEHQAVVRKLVGALVAEARLSSTRLQGLPSLAATIFMTVRDEALTRRLLQVACFMFQEFRADDARRMRNDSLVLADLLVREVPKLCDYFNEQQFDVVDLSDVVCAWLGSAFASYCPFTFVQRALDVFLFEGPEALLGLAFGVLKVRAAEIERGGEDYDAFAQLVDAAATLREPAHIDEAFRAGFEVGAKGLVALRKDKDWFKCMQVAGTLKFVQGVGDPSLGTRAVNAPQSSETPGGDLAPPAADRSARALSGDLSSARDGESKGAPSAGGRGGGGGGAAGAGAGAGSGVGAGVAGGADAAAQQADLVMRLQRIKDATLDDDLRALVAETQRELRRQQDSLLASHEEVARLREKLEQQSGALDESSAESSWSSAASDGEDADAPDAEEKRPAAAAAAATASGKDGESKSRPTSGNLDTPHRRRRSTMVGAGAGAGAGGSDAPLPKGLVPYSKLFQYQQFPCLYMEGYLLKARSHGSNAKAGSVFGKLHNRFFVLQGSFLTYFKTHRANRPANDVSVDLRGRLVTRVDKHKLGKYGFEISEVENRSECMYVLFAQDSDERNVWMQVLQAASEA
jgi:hypothetical protein